MWYFGELGKLRVYRVGCYVFQVLLRIAGRRWLDCTHMFETMFKDSGILLFIFVDLRLTFKTIVVSKKYDISFYVF